MNGWATKLALWRTAGAFGGQVGDVMRPPGIESASITTQVETHKQRDAMGFTAAAITLRQSWELTVAREHGVDALSDWWVEMLAPYITGQAVDSPVLGYTTTSRVARNDTALQYFNAQVQLADGTTRLLAGMVPSRVELMIQAGRLVSEQITFSTLQNLALATGSMLAEVVVPAIHRTAGIQARHALQIGSTWNTTALAALQSTFSTQLIFSRDVTPCAFGPDGLATRHEVVGGWELVGKSLVRAPAGLYAAYTDAAVDARMWWQLTDPGDANHVWTLDVLTKAKTGDQTLLDAEQIEINLDWLTMAAPTGTLMFQTTKIN